MLCGLSVASVVMVCSPLIPDLSPLIYGKEWEKGAEIAAILV